MALKVTVSIVTDGVTGLKRIQLLDVDRGKIYPSDVETFPSGTDAATESWGLRIGNDQTYTALWAETLISGGALGDAVPSKRADFLALWAVVSNQYIGGSGSDCSCFAVAMDKFQVSCELENAAHLQALGVQELAYYIANLVFSDNLITLGITDWKADTCCQSLTFDLHNADVPNYGQALFNPGATAPEQTRALLLIMKGDGVTAYVGAYIAQTAGMQTFPTYTPADDSGATVVDADLTAQGWDFADANTLLCQPTLAVALQESAQLTLLRGAIVEALGDIESDLTGFRNDFKFYDQSVETALNYSTPSLMGAIYLEGWKILNPNLEPAYVKFISSGGAEQLIAIPGAISAVDCGVAYLPRQAAMQFRDVAIIACNKLFDFSDVTDFGNNLRVEFYVPFF